MNKKETKEERKMKLQNENPRRYLNIDLFSFGHGTVDTATIHRKAIDCQYLFSALTGTLDSN